MKAYSIFDDYSKEALSKLENAGVDVTVHPLGVPRPDNSKMKGILESYDCVIIGTSQKITEDMFDNIETKRIIATASVGLDHIKVPENKKNLVTIINTPKANAQSVTEYTFGCALSCVKRMIEGNKLYCEGKNNKSLYHKPEDLSGKTLGVVGAGNISSTIMKYAKFFGMNVQCWTRNPDKHNDLLEMGVCFTSIESLAKTSDVISVNLPNTIETINLISKNIVNLMKDNCVFISVSRVNTIDVEALFDRAKKTPSFYVCLDIDINEDVIAVLPKVNNVMVTPHIAGGTVETRKRMFMELSESISMIV